MTSQDQDLKDQYLKDQYLKDQYLKDPNGNLSNVEEILLQSEKTDLMNVILDLVQLYSNFMQKVQTDYTEIMNRIKEIFTSIDFQPNFYTNKSIDSASQETIPITDEEFVKTLNFMDQNYLSMCQIYEQISNK